MQFKSEQRLAQKIVHSSNNTSQREFEIIVILKNI